MAGPRTHAKTGAALWERALPPARVLRQAGNCQRTDKPVAARSTAAVCFPTGGMGGTTVRAYAQLISDRPIAAQQARRVATEESLTLLCQNFDGPGQP